MNILLGLVMVVLCCVLQCATIIGLRSWLMSLESANRIKGHVLHHIALLAGVMICLLVGIVVQVCIWGLLFFALGEVETVERAFYFSYVNFTTLGYGDIVLSDRRAILGPIEASNGILMVGLSTSFLYTIFDQLKRIRDAAHGRKAAAGSD